MGRSELERLSKEELIELVLRLQRPETTSRTSSKPPYDRSQRAGEVQARRGQAWARGPQPSETPDEIVEHRPDQCSDCGAALPADLPAETVSVHERIELPEVRPLVTHHRRLAVSCPTCGTRVVAPCRRQHVARRSDRACMRWRPTSRPSRRCPTSGCKPRSPTCSGSPSARAVS